MKVLKRRFGMTKEQVEENMRLLPYHRLYLRTNRDIVAIRSNSTISSVDKLKMIKQLREQLVAQWDKLNEVS